MIGRIKDWGGISWFFSRDVLCVDGTRMTMVQIRLRCFSLKYFPIAEYVLHYEKHNDGRAPTWYFSRGKLAEPL